MNITPINNSFNFNHINFTSKEPKTITIMGSSKTTDEILDAMDICSKATKALVLAGNNIVTGCGNSGIMGSAYYSAKENSIIENGKPIQNQAFIMQPMWGDEDLENCVVKGYSNSEAQRIEQFREMSDKFLVFPGSATTLQEATTLIAKNYYAKPEDKKEVILVGREFFKGLEEQYEQLYNSKLIKCPPEELFTIVDTVEEIEEAVEKD